MSNYIDHSPEKTPDVWEIPAQQETQYESVFNQVTNNGDQISGAQVKVLFEKAQVRPEHLITIWGLSDVGDKGYLTKKEFVVAIHLLQSSKRGMEVPTALPQTLSDYLAKSGGAAQPSVQFDLPEMSGLSPPVSNSPPMQPAKQLDLPPMQPQVQMAPSLDSPPKPATAVIPEPVKQRPSVAEEKKQASHTNFDDLVTTQSKGQILSGDHHNSIQKLEKIIEATKAIIQKDRNELNSIT